MNNIDKAIEDLQKIDKLLEYAYKELEKFQWINVKDRIPIIGEFVLVYTPVKSNSLIEIAMLDILYGFINPSMGYGPMKNITHWMPLPKPPEEK